MALTDIGTEAAESSSGSSGGSKGSREEYERFDVTECKWAKMHPGPTAVQGVPVALRYVGPGPDADDDERGFAGIVLKNAAVPDDESFEDVGIFESNTEKGDDFKIVNKADDDVSVYEMGVSVGDLFESEEVDSFGDDDQLIVLKMSTGAGRSIIRSLDVAGMRNAGVERDEDGNLELSENGYPVYNNGLIEKHPGNDNENYTPPRYARDPQLRPDVEGREIVVMLQRLAKIQEDYDGHAYWGTLLANLEDDRMEELSQAYAEDGFYDRDSPEDFLHDINGTTMIELGPTTEFEPDKELLYKTKWMDWSYPDESTVQKARQEQGFE